MGEMPVDPIPESPGARQHVGEPITAIRELGSGEQLSSTTNESATAPSATAGTTGSSGVEAAVIGIALESRATNLATPKDQTAPLEASEGMVGPTIQPPSPQAVPPATAEDDEVEEIEREEP